MKPNLKAFAKVLEEAIPCACFFIILLFLKYERSDFFFCECSTRSLRVSEHVSSYFDRLGAWEECVLYVGCIHLHNTDFKNSSPQRWDETHLMPGKNVFSI